MDGVIYGEGGYTSEADFLASTFSDALFFAVVGTVAVGLIAWAARAYLRKNPTLLNSLKEKFEVKTGDAVLT